MDHLDFIESCYDSSANHVSWGVSLASTLHKLVPQAAQVMCSAYRIDPAVGVQLLDLSGCPRFTARTENLDSARRFVRIINDAPDRVLQIRASYGTSVPAIETLSGLPPAHQPPLRRALGWPQGDCLGLFGTLDGARGFIISPAGPVSLRPSARRRSEIVRLSEHLAVGYWLRRLRPSNLAGNDGDVVAVHAPEGKQLDRVATSADRALTARLIDAVRGMDRARCRRQKRSSVEATELWQALVGGQFALVEQFERGGRRVILAVRCRSPLPRLSEREHAVALAAARGLPNKLIADDLGISPSTVGVHLAAAMRKLGCTSRLALAYWFGLAHHGRRNEDGRD